MKKIHKLIELVEAENSVEMIRLACFAEDFQEELECAFENADISWNRLNLAMTLFVDDLSEKDLFAEKDILAYSRIIFFVVRHTWEFLDEEGELKTGDDLHAVSPFHFSREKILGLKDLIGSMKYMIEQKENES